MMQDDLPNPLRPNQVRMPQRGAVAHDPVIFDTRKQSWKIHFPDDPAFNDPRTPSDYFPRLRAASSCNLLELYSRLRTAFAMYQTEIYPDKTRPSVLYMPFQLIEPKAGWKLQNLTQQKTYEVGAVGKDRGDPQIFNGQVYLKGAEGPDQGDIVQWIDPLGQLDSQQKLVELLAEGESRLLLDVFASEGDVAGAKSKALPPIVTYEMIKQTPGSQSGQPFGGNKEIKPRIRTIESNPDDPREALEIRGWVMDTMVQFKCYASLPGSADRMSLWLLAFLRLYTGVLKLLGVQEMMYWQMTPDRDARPVQHLHCRAVQYVFRLEEVVVSKRPKLKNFDTILNLFDSESGVVTGETYEEGLSRWDQTHDSSGHYLLGTSSLGDNY